jgi:hypothetical protein
VRARNLKPSFFVNSKLAECEPLTRILFAGLWCMADRAGRLDDDPKKIKVCILPYDQTDVSTMLARLQHHAFILRYEAKGNRYIQIVNFSKHQHPHIKESESTIPAPCKHRTSTVQKRPLIDSLLPLTESMPSGMASDILGHFNKSCHKNLTLTKARRDLIEKRRAAGRTPEEMKAAIDIFAKDEWPDRHKYMDLVYVIGERNGVDNLDKWLNSKPHHERKELDFR